MGQAIYVYCFARPGSAIGLTAESVDGRGSVEALDAGEVSAVVSRVALEEFTGPDAEATLADPEWIVPRACRHEAVVEAVLRRSPVLPVRFGAVFSSVETLALFIEEHRDKIASFLDNLAEQREWAVKASVDLARASAWLMASEADLAARRSTLPPQPGARYFAEKRLKEDTLKRVKIWSRETAAQLYEELSAAAGDIKPLALPRTATPASETVLNAALLLPRCHFMEFHERFEDLRKRHRERGIELVLTGPWPPYSFCPELGR